MSTENDAEAERRCRVVITEQELLCKKQCGFYGTPQWNGLCSQCWRQHQMEQKRRQDFNKNRSLLGQEDRRASVDPTSSLRAIIRKSPSVFSPIAAPDSPQPLEYHFTRSSSPDSVAADKQLHDYLVKTFSQTIAQEVEGVCNALIAKLIKNKLASMDDLSMIVQDFYSALPERLAKYTAKLPSFSSTTLLEHVESFVCVRAYGVLFCTRSDEEVMDLSLQERIRSLYWVTQGFLDTVLDFESEKVEDLLVDAITEIVDMNSHKVISEKFDCLMRCSAKIFEALRESTKAPASADEFLPVLIYVILKSNPPLMQSNLSFIHRFSLTSRTCRGETGYHFTNLCCAIRFIQDMNAHSLRMPKEEFEAYTSGAKTAPTRTRSHVNAMKSLEDSLKRFDVLDETQAQQNEQLDNLSTSVDERLNKLKLEVEKLENVTSFQLPELQKNDESNSEITQLNGDTEVEK
ncbi:hypothetical protein M3Y98_00357500 [Aphelenchoides besseyi]|nr:hypothetical protein M3Y98_00357500 [Aphelenchoides besseyi]